MKLSTMHTVNHRHPNLSSTLWLWPEFLPFTGEFLSSTRCHAVLECWTFSALLLSLSLPELFNCCCTESNHDSHLIGSYCLWLSITWLNYTLHSHAPALVVTRKTLAIPAAINQFISHSKIILPTLICMAVAAAAPPRLVSLYFVFYNTSWGTALTSYPPIVIVHSESFPFDRELNIINEQPEEPPCIHAYNTVLNPSTSTQPPTQTTNAYNHNSFTRQSKALQIAIAAPTVVAPHAKLGRQRCCPAPTTRWTRATLYSIWAPIWLWASPLLVVYKAFPSIHLWRIWKLTRPHVVVTGPWSLSLAVYMSTVSFLLVSLCVCVPTFPPLILHSSVCPQSFNHPSIHGGEDDNIREQTPSENEEKGRSFRTGNQCA